MKVYFTASLRGKEYYCRNYDNIVELIKKNGCSLTELVMTNVLEAVEKQTKEENAQKCRIIRKNIEEADLVVAEISHSSVAVGFEITTALNLNKQVLLLHIPEHYSPLLEGVVDKNLIICEYTLNNLEEKLKECLEKIENNMTVRFNFFLSKELAGRLDTVALSERINKSEYVRQLIEKDMKRNKKMQSRKNVG